VRIRPIRNRRQPEALPPLTTSSINAAISHLQSLSRTAGRAALLGLALMTCSQVGIGPVAAATLDVRVSVSAGDAEESSTGTMSLTSTALQLIHDTTDQIVGMRWAGLTIPIGATITHA